MDKARQYIVTQPIDYLVLLAQKTHLFWQGDEIGRNQDLYFWRHYTAILSATMWKWGIAFPSVWSVLWRWWASHWPFAIALSPCPFCCRAVRPFRHRLFRHSALSPASYSPAADIRRLWWVLRSECPAAAPFLGCYRYGRRSDLLHGVRQCGSGAMNMEGTAAVHYNLGNAYAKEANWKGRKRHSSGPCTLIRPTGRRGTIWHLSRPPKAKPTLRAPLFNGC